LSFSSLDKNRFKLSDTFVLGGVFYNLFYPLFDLFRGYVVCFDDEAL